MLCATKIRMGVSDRTGGKKRWGKNAHLDLDTEHSLSEENVSDGLVNEVSSGLSGVDHEPVGELHGKKE